MMGLRKMHHIIFRFSASTRFSFKLNITLFCSVVMCASLPILTAALFDITKCITMHQIITQFREVFNLLFKTCASFVAHFVHSIFSFFIVVNQFYDAEIIKEYVIRGNAAVLKCSIPSFVADFVYVSEWIDEEGTIYKHSDSYGVYHTHNLVH